MLKNLPKMLPGISQKFHLLCFSVFLLCLHYTPKLITILSIGIENCKYWLTRVFHYKVTVLLESIDLRMHLSAFLQFENFTDCSIRQYQSILDELISVFWNIYLLWQHNTLAYYAFYYSDPGLLTLVTDSIKEQISTGFTLLHLYMYCITCVQHVIVEAPPRVRRVLYLPQNTPRVLYFSYTQT